MQFSNQMHISSSKGRASVVWLASYCKAHSNERVSLANKQGDSSIAIVELE